MILNINDKIALVVCSNGKNIEDKVRLEKLEGILVEMGLVPVFTKYIYRDKYGRGASPQLRADELVSFYRNNEIKAIFDISGGDIANEVLEYLDYGVIKENYKPFFGYSDLTTVLNSLVRKTDKINYLYQILNIIENEEIRTSFVNTFLKKQNSLFDVNWRFFQGTKIEGEIVGGNIRCFLKLAGTEYFPKVENKVLFIEGLGTSIEGLLTHLAQLKQLGVFDGISGLLIGTFTKIEKEFSVEEIFEIIQEYIPPSLPVAKTQEVGHAKDSKALKLGGKIYIKNELI
ncbi:S66 family peptidase [Gemella haemolysans]|uniref:S66 family peptidase n=1 Tax=Gemella haemolysans TaxID=1379 RepID=UPI00195D79BF|nr:S66 peptidase family protein [Gemella haemolysans]VTX69528.1 Microcin C7 self-immunity protein MccF [Gemella haemolysans]